MDAVYAFIVEINHGFGATIFAVITLLIMPNVITKKNHIHLVSANTIPYAGLCITVKGNQANNTDIHLYTVN